MLVLSRRVNETLMIGDDIAITIKSISKDQVKIGIEAPDDVAINRSEVYQKMLREHGAAVSLANKGEYDG